MTERIERMAKSVLEKTIYPEPKAIEYDRMDLLLSDVLLQTKRLCDYMVAQDVVIGNDARLIGQIRFNACPYPSNVFPRTGHARFGEVRGAFYNKPIDNLCTFEWQHSTPNFADIIENGIEGLIERIHASMKVHADDERKMNFLAACEMMCKGIIAWEEKCASECRKRAEAEENTERRAELLTMASVLDNVPRKPASSFREAVQSVYFCFDFLSDSIGTPDRYLYRHYKADKEKGILEDCEAKELLQEFFIRIQSFTPITSSNFRRGGECHFAVGGYTANGEDGYNELSEIIVTGVMELPLYIPQISLRHTPKTPKSVLYHLMDLERKDPHKRIAFVNDEPRIKGFMENCGLSREDAINYTMVGCNEPALQGGIWFGGCTSNLARSLTNTLYGRKDEIVACEDFEAFYAIYKEELYKDLGEILHYCDAFNLARSKDENVLSSLFLKGCIEEGKSVTHGGALSISGTNTMGLVCVIDSLSIIKQFVYDEKTVTLAELIDALEKDWEGYDVLRNTILKKGKFFGNSYELSDGMARRFTADLHAFLYVKKNIFGKPFLLGNLTGYNQHYTFFGALTPATPDGRYAGDAFMVGIGQSEGRDREGLGALLLSVAGFDPMGIYCGPCVTNINVDAALVKNDDNFAKLVDAVEVYFAAGGLHVQINAVTKEELLAARKTPEKYASLRVRVSGFSDYFVNLNHDLQENVIARTEKLK